MRISKFNESQELESRLHPEAQINMADFIKLGFDVKVVPTRGENGVTRIRCTKKNCDFNSCIDVYKSYCNKLVDKYTFIVNHIDFTDENNTCSISIDIKNK